MLNQHFQKNAMKRQTQNKMNSQMREINQEGVKMKTKYKHIYFEDESYMYPERKTQVWVCRNKNEETIGYIEWFNK